MSRATSTSTLRRMKQVKIMHLLHFENEPSLCVCREEVQEHMSRAAHQSQRVTELEGLLDGVKARVQDLEDRCLGKAVQQHSQTQQLQQEKQNAQVGQIAHNFKYIIIP